MALNWGGRVWGGGDSKLKKPKAKKSGVAPAFGQGAVQVGRGGGRVKAAVWGHGRNPTLH